MADEPERDEGGEGSEQEQIDALKAEQDRQGGILDEILDRLKGSEGTAHAKAQAHTENRLEHPPAETIAAQVKQAVIDVDAERAAKEAADAHEADHKRIREEAEKPPREMTAGIRGRIQAAMYGRPDQ